MALVMLAVLTACEQGGSASATGEPTENLATNPEEMAVEEVPGVQARRLFRTGRAGNLLEEGYQVDGKRTGAWVTYHPGSDIPQTVTNYVEGKANGIYMEFNERGQMRMLASYRNNKLHGYWAKYRFGRPTMEANYKDGELHGSVYEYDIGTGAVQKEITYANGVLDGPYRYFDEDGNITIEYVYKNGKKVKGGAVNTDGTNEPR